MDEDNESLKALELFRAACYKAELAKGGGISLRKKNNKSVSKEEYLGLMKLLKENGFVSNFQHPDPCWIVEDARGRIMVTGKNLLVFSSEDAVRNFVKKYHSYFRIPFFAYRIDWYTLVDRYSKSFEIAVLDFGEEGDFNHIPLLKIPEREGRA